MMSNIVNKYCLKQISYSDLVNLVTYILTGTELFGTINIQGKARQDHKPAVVAEWSNLPCYKFK